MSKHTKAGSGVEIGPVLVVVAHPDDETLGAGGSIARHVEEGRDVLAISLTDGVSSRGAQRVPRTQIRERRRAAEQAASILGFQWFHNGDLPDNGLDRVPMLDVVRVIERVKLQAKPTLVYTHFPYDLNIDHRIVCQAVLTAFRPQPGESCVEIRTCEIPSSSDYGAPIAPIPFTPHISVSIVKTWKKKLKALEAYNAEMRAYPHARSYEGLEALAKTRGASVGVSMAEGFHLLRKVEL